MKTGEPLPAGHMLDGRYRINKVIGVGGMGRVYLSNDTRLANRPVAVKEMIVGDEVQEKKAAEDFAREARVLSLLTHPGIPNLYDNFVENQRHYLVMEYVAGGDLQGLLDKLGPRARLPEPTVLRWAHQMLDVLGFLHAQKPPIVYRDLKPANIMIDRAGRAMLIDFGIARFLPPGGRGTQIGSVGYAPPEQYMGKTEPRSDLYALAATMHHVLSGRDPQIEPPFSFPPLREIAPEVSARTATAVMAGLEQDVNRRPASAAAMRAMLPPAPGESAGYPTLEAPAAGPQVNSPVGMSTMRTAQMGDGSSPASSGGIASASPPAPMGSGSALSTMQTVVLADSLNGPASEPNKVGAPHGPAGATPRKLEPAADVVRTLLKRIPSARSLKEMLPSRALATPALSAPAGAAPASPSSTAKTSELPRSPLPFVPPRGPISTGGHMAERDGRKASSPARAAHDRKPPLPPLASARLIAGASAEFALAGGRMVIGRAAPGGDDSIDIDLSRLHQGAERVSRRHAEIIQRGAEYYIRDLGSMNGTYIAGRGRLGRDQLYKLRDRDQVILGSARLEFRKG